jgi:phenylpropionate dioxygenase-like ring-hydroxylating dioxygenase large terminal subunit
MIRNQWYVVLDSREVRSGRPVGVLRLGMRLVFWRLADGKVICARDLCAHLGARLSQGKVIDGRIKCPFHGIEYDAEGHCRLVPAMGRGRGEYPKGLQLHTLPTHEAHGFLWVWWGDEAVRPAQPEFFTDLGKGFSYSRFGREWPVHYSRMIENQLDVMHLPFVHYNTIGAGQETLVDGPYVKLEGDTLKLWVFNRKDDGTPFKGMQELDQPDYHPQLVFHFPNLWMNWIADDLRIVVAFVPVDEQNSLMYGRFYQRSVRVPILRELFNLFGKWGSTVIANQDHRVVSNQLPKKTQLKRMGEKILPGDGGILAYRMHRHELKVKAGQITDDIIRPA